MIARRRCAMVPGEFFSLSRMAAVALCMVAAFCGIVACAEAAVFPDAGLDTAVREELEIP
ncbi:MAG: hypothetical protein QG656_1306, partial [Candidatus Hydrogenedentes bacterium]|nr:hypothetical protein [Candidatus Hydrogenedentota bacterium]